MTPGENILAERIQELQQENQDFREERYLFKQYLRALIAASKVVAEGEDDLDEHVTIYVKDEDWQTFKDLLYTHNWPYYRG